MKSTGSLYTLQLYDLPLLYLIWLLISLFLLRILVSFCFFLFSLYVFINLLHRPNKVKFVVDSQGFDLTPRPSPGDVVTFSYQHYTKLLTPVNPRIERVRGDLSWQEIEHNFKSEIMEPQILNGMVIVPSAFPLSLSFLLISSPPLSPFHSSCF